MTFLAYVDLPTKPRTYVRRVDKPWHSWTVDPSDAHPFPTAAAAEELVASWSPAVAREGLTGSVSRAAAVRAVKR